MKLRFLGKLCCLIPLFGITAVFAQEGSQVYDLEEFVVSGAEFDAFRAAIDTQRNADNIKTVVDAGAFGDVTEGNVGEFLKFLPGVSVDSVAADVRSVSVRGLASNFTPVTVDGNRMASAASSSTSRTFEFEQVSLNNVARIEVTKVPTPNMEADSLGGSVNMVSRNAFELDNRRLNYRVHLNVPGDHISLSKTPGPGANNTRKVRPGFDFTYSDPISENFGIVLNYMKSEAFTPQNYFMTQWDATRDMSTSNPYLRYFALRNGPKLSFRESVGLKADLRIKESTILSFGYQRNDYSTFFFNRQLRWETQTDANNYGPTFTNAINDNGRFRHELTAREKLGVTNHVDFGVKHFLDGWEIDYDAYYSKSKNEYRDTANGHFERTTFRTPAGLRISYNDITETGPTSVTTLRDGVTVDPFLFDESTRLELLRSSPETAVDEIYGAKGNVRRNFTIAGRSASLQTGVLYRMQERTIERQRFEYVPASSFFSAGPGNEFFRDVNHSDVKMKWGWPESQWQDPYKLYEYFQENPSQFTFREVGSVIYNEENRQYIEEEVTAGYLMGTISFMENRFKVLTGVRYERTQTFAEGYLRDENAIFARNPDGTFQLRNPNFPDNTQNRIYLPEFDGPLVAPPALLALRERGMYQQRETQSNSYGDFYPSLHLTYEVTPNFQIRGAYARTLGRPDLRHLAPGTQYESESEDGTSLPKIIIANPELTAYHGDNFDLSLEYYFDTGGVLSAGVFYKKISGFIDGETDLLTVELAERLGIDPVYAQLGYEVQRTVNAGDVTIKGYELSFVQNLHFLPDWLTGFSVFANATVLTTSGDYGEGSANLINSSYVPGFVKQTYNWGVTYDRGPLDIRLKWNDRGKQMRDTGDIRGNLQNGDVWNRFFDRRLTTDLNIEYRFSRRVRVFLNGRNIFNVATDQLRMAADTPGYAQLEQRQKFGSLWSFGVKGTF